MFGHYIQSNYLFLSYCKRCCLNMYNVYIDAQCATVSPLSAEYSICSAEASVSAIQEKVANMQLFINLLVVQYGSSQSVSYSKRGQACILEIALKMMVVKKKVFKNPYVTRGA